jgi:hypothetical protein
MQEIMTRMTDCEDGAKFDREHASRRRANSRLGRALCAYEAVLVNMGGVLSDLVQTNYDNLVLTVAGTSPEQIAAFERAEQLLRDYPALVDFEESARRTRAAYLFALSVVVVIEHQDLGPNNKIPATLVQTGAAKSKPTKTSARPSSSTSACPDPTKTPVSPLNISV